MGPDCFLGQTTISKEEKRSRCWPLGSNHAHQYKHKPHNVKPVLQAGRDTCGVRTERTREITATDIRNTATGRQSCTKS